MQIIPVSNDNRQILTTVLNGQVVTIELYFIPESDGGWFLNCHQGGSTNIPLIQGTRLSNFSHVFKNILVDFQGDILVQPLTASLSPLLSDSPWGITHNLVYLTFEELNNLGLINVTLQA